MKLPLTIKVRSLLAGLILGTAPVYWFANGYVIEIQIMKTICIAAFCFAVVVPTFDLAGRGLRTIKAFPRGFGLIEYFVFSAAVLPGLLFSDNYWQALAFFGNVAFAFLFVMLVYQYESNPGVGNVWPGARYFSVGVLSLIPFCLFVVTNAAFSWPPFLNPYGNYSDFSLGSVPLSYTGFGGSRTGWGSGVAVLFPLLLSSVYLVFRSKALIVLVAVLAFLSVAIPAGRGALIAILASATVGLYMTVGKRVAYWILFVGVSSILYVLFVGNLEHLRLVGVSDFSEDELTTGRYEGYLLGIDLIFKNPFFGVGAGAVDLTTYGANAAEIHNTFLHIAAQLGVVPGVLVFISYLNILWIGYKVAIKDTSYVPHFMSLLAGFIICFSEPNMIFGAMFNMLPLWFSLANVLYGRYLLQLNSTAL